RPVPGPSLPPVSSGSGVAPGRTITAPLPFSESSSSVPWIAPLSPVSAVGDGDGVLVEAVGVKVDVGAGVAVLVADGVGVGVALGSGVGEASTAVVGSGGVVGVDVGIGVSVAASSGTGVSVAVGSGSGMGVGDGGSGVGVGGGLRSKPVMAAISSIVISGRPWSPAVQDQPSMSPSASCRALGPRISVTQPPPSTLL